MLNKSSNATNYHKSIDKIYKCNDHIILEPAKSGKSEKSLTNTQPVYVTQRDGVYVLIFRITDTTAQFNLGVHVEMRSDYGYLSAADWPLLPFYGFMWVLYMVFGLVWLVVSFLQWRDLLRVQFWIGAVILLGMLEKATFYAEFQSINNTGKKSGTIN